MMTAVTTTDWPVAVSGSGPDDILLLGIGAIGQICIKKKKKEMSPPTDRRYRTHKCIIWKIIYTRQFYVYAADRIVVRHGKRKTYRAHIKCKYNFTAREGRWRTYLYTYIISRVTTPTHTGVLFSDLLFQRKSAHPLRTNRVHISYNLCIIAL